MQSTNQTMGRKGLFAIIAAVLFAATTLGFSGVSSARNGGAEVVGGGGAPAAVCAPVKSLTYRGDARVGETGLSSIDVNYSTAPCDKTIPTRVEVVMFQSSTGEIVYSDTDALASGKFTVFGVKVRTSYQVKVSVVNATTGEVTGSQTIFAAAIPKGV